MTNPCHCLYHCFECHIHMTVTQSVEGNGICKPCRVVIGMKKRRNEQRVQEEAEAIAKAVW